jgi:hypothetical protein
MANNYLRRGIRNTDSYVWVSKKSEANRLSCQNDLASHNGLRTERPLIKATKTAHDIINEYREKGLHIIDIL